MGLSDGKGQWKPHDRKRLLCQSARALALFYGRPIISTGVQPVKPVKPVGQSLILETEQFVSVKYQVPPWNLAFNPASAKATEKRIKHSRK